MGEAADDPFGLLGGTLDNKYEVSGIVAEGGFGVVYRALHRGLQKPIALKVLKVPAELTGATRVAYLEKFAQEARLIAALEHPAIVRVVDFGVSPLGDRVDTPWMALEWLEGATLESQIEARQGQGADPGQVFALVERVLDAIAFAHDEGVVHRDLKPANLMLVANKRGDVGLKVLDFGIAKAVSAEESATASSGATRTSSALVAFSPHYAAPEQLTGMRTGAWTDVHALALILVEMLCGRPAYRGNDLSEIYACALAPVRPTPATRGLDVGAWEPVLARALAFKPAERFANARQLLDALRGALPHARYASLGMSLPPMPGGAPVSPTLRGAEVVAPPSERRPTRVLVAAGVATATLVAIAVAIGTSGSPPAPAAAIAPAVTTAAPPQPPPAPAAVPEPVAPAPAVIAVPAAPAVIDAGTPGSTRVAPRAASAPVRRPTAAMRGSAPAVPPVAVAPPSRVTTVPVE